MASSRDRVVWSHILQLYKGYPNLWDKSNISYGNRRMMSSSYNFLAQVYRERLDKQASGDDMRLKLRNLRKTYYKELRKIKAAKQKGNKYTPSVWYFDYLSFLENAENTRSNESAIDTLQNDTAEIKEAKQKGIKYTPSLWYLEHLSYLENTRSYESAIDKLQNDTAESSNETQCLIPTNDTDPVDDMALEDSDIEFVPGSSKTLLKLPQKTESLAESGSLTERQDQLVNDSQNTLMKDEHWEVVGKSIGYQLRDLNKEQYTIVSKLISDAIYFGRLKKLSVNSHIEIGEAPFAESQSPQTYSSTEHLNMEFHVDEPADHNTRFKHEQDVNYEV